MNERQLFLLILFFTVFLLSVKLYSPYILEEEANDIDLWLMNISVLPKLLANISPNDSLKGIVVASPSREAPNYYFHWVREYDESKSNFLVQESSLQKLIIFTKRVIYHNLKEFYGIMPLFREIFNGFQLSVGSVSLSFKSTGRFSMDHGADHRLMALH
jgi:hypothetical protein